MERIELQDTLALLQEGRGYSLAALAQAEAQGDLRQADASRANLAKADAAITILEAELTSTQAN